MKKVLWALAWLVYGVGLLWFVPFLWTLLANELNGTPVSNDLEPYAVAGVAILTFLFSSMILFGGRPVRMSTRAVFAIFGIAVFYGAYTQAFAELTFEDELFLEIGIDLRRPYKTIMVMISVLVLSVWVGGSQKS
ncbi:MAG: hypothetical protein QNJ44_11225 [Rhodobacter sp.]|nr:hypothetical protein [Rhodobacter sp.]